MGPSTAFFLSDILFESFPARQMPLVLPHDLVSAMVKAGIWPSQIGKAESVHDWWEHNAKKNNWYCNHPAFTDQKHEPLCLYGDDACLTKAGNEKMTCITLSHCLDTRSDSLVTSWPLCLFRCVPWMYYCLQPISHYWETSLPIDPIIQTNLRLFRLGMIPFKLIWPRCLGCKCMFTWRTQI